jgi:hypothetical protein
MSSDTGRHAQRMGPLDLVQVQDLVVIQDRQMNRFLGLVHDPDQKGPAGFS